MKFSETLRNEFYQTKRDVYENLKPFLLALAKESEKGCKLKLVNANYSTKKYLFKRLEMDGIIIIDEDLLYWVYDHINLAKPCIKCNKPDLYCKACPDLATWESHRVKPVNKKVTITFKGNTHFSISVK